MIYPKITKLILSKSQKLIDRFLFILLQKTVDCCSKLINVPKNGKYWADLMSNATYDRYKQYFGYLDTGRKAQKKKEEIFCL
jgi:hypothetical protein